MNPPEDDPEKRIQQLERPLTEQAHTSELGTTVPPGSWSPPPPPPPPPYYGPPMSPPPVPSSGSGLRLGWIVFVLLILGLTVGGGAILVTNHLNAGRTSPGLPTISGGGGTFTTATRPSRSTPTPPVELGRHRGAPRSQEAISACRVSTRTSGSPAATAWSRSAVWTTPW